MTLLGPIDSFANAVRALIELDFEMVQTYEVIIDQVSDQDLKRRLQSFKVDHERHVKELSHLLITHQEKVIYSTKGRDWLLPSQVEALKDDQAIIAVILAVEAKTRQAYREIMSHQQMWGEAESILIAGYLDENQHHYWLERSIR